MNEGGDSDDGEEGRAGGDAVGGSEEPIPGGDAVVRAAGGGRAEADTDAAESDGVDGVADGDAAEDEGAAGDEATDGDAADGSWSAAAPTASDEDIPLPWTVVDAEELDAEVPEEFEELRFVGPKTAAALRDSAVDVDDIVRKRVSYRDLTERGVHPGVAAKIRREHSLSWSFDSADSDLSRRSSQVRGLDDEERAWVAASSGWGEAEDAAETDGSGDAASAESAWQARGDGADASAGTESETDPATDGESAWRERAGASAGDGGDGPTRDDEAAWRAAAVGSDGRATERAGDADGEAAWRERADDSSRAAASGPSLDTLTDAEAAWREQSAPTPVTALDDVDDDYADRLADAGIRSVRRLATADPESVADALELDPRRVRRWVDAARATLD